jgi:hypothetical protein
MIQRPEDRQQVFREDPDLTSAILKEVLGANAFMWKTVAAMNPAYSGQIESTLDQLAVRINELIAADRKRGIYEGDGAQRRLTRLVHQGMGIRNNAPTDKDEYTAQSRLMSKFPGDIHMDRWALNQLVKNNFMLQQENYKRAMGQTSLGAVISPDHPYWTRSGRCGEDVYMTCDISTPWRSDTKEMRDVRMTICIDETSELVFNFHDYVMHFNFYDDVEGVMVEDVYEGTLPGQTIVAALTTMFNVFRPDENQSMVLDLIEMSADPLQRFTQITNAVWEHPLFMSMITEEYMSSVPWPFGATERLPLGEGNAGELFFLRKYVIARGYVRDRIGEQQRHYVLLSITFADWIIDIRVPTVESRQEGFDKEVIVWDVRHAAKQLYGSNDVSERARNISTIPVREWRLLKENLQLTMDVLTASQTVSGVDHGAMVIGIDPGVEGGDRTVINGEIQ